MSLVESLHNISILVVEDDQDTCELYERSLRAAGATVRSATSMEAALVLLTAVHPDVVLCDLHMPDHDGYELLREVLADPELAGIPVIAISGSHPGLERERALEAGFARHLAKPSKLREIMTAVADLAA
jgi:two-component system CheB/CheR fusion protein